MKIWECQRAPAINASIGAWYKFVNVSNLDRINYFIENRRDEFLDNDVGRIVDRLEGRVTNWIKNLE